MKLLIHNHRDGSQQEIEGDPHTLQVQLLTMFPWLDGCHAYGDLDTMIDAVDSTQGRSIEIVDDTLHPFLQLQVTHAIG